MRLFTLAFVLLLSAASAQAQRYKPSKGSPEDLLDRYYQMINDGELLTPEGWKKAIRLFEQPSKYPVNGTIYVTTAYPLGNGPMEVNGDHAVAYQKWVDDLGSINASLQYKPPPPENAKVEGVIRICHLKRIAGEWRIEGSLTTRACSRKAAIRYLEYRRAKSIDPETQAKH
jgi:hypothetical protein